MSAQAGSSTLTPPSASGWRRSRNHKTDYSSDEEDSDAPQDTPQKNPVSAPHYNGSHISVDPDADETSDEDDEPSPLPPSSPPAVRIAADHNRQQSDQRTLSVSSETQTAVRIPTQESEVLSARLENTVAPTNTQPENPQMPIQESIDPKSVITPAATTDKQRQRGGHRNFTTDDDRDSPEPQTPPNPNQDSPHRSEFILDSWDVAAFILNQQIGTGIFTRPATVLLLCGSRKVALALWIVGFLASLLSALIYLQLSKAFFWTGGELIFIDETFRNKRYLPRLLGFTIYSFFFLALYTSATNASELARQILYCTSAPALVEKWKNGDGTAPEINVPLQSFIAIVAIAIICLIHYFSKGFGRFLNKTSMVVKILILIVVIIAGAVKASKHNIFVSQETPKHPLLNNSRQAKTTALIYVLFSYEGWENASFVLGEIRDFKTYRRGILLSIGIVGALYITVNAVFLASVPEGTFISTFVPELFGFTERAVQAWSVLVAMSSAGNLVAVIYTCSAVKQVIGRANILPWSRLWAQHSRHFNTPTGGLLLHWLVSTISIIACTRIKTTDGYSYPGTLQVYGHSVFSVFVAIAYLLIPRTIESPEYERQRNPTKGLFVDKNHFTGRWRHRAFNINLIVGFSYLALNLYVVIGYVLPPYMPGFVKGWVAAAVNGAIMVVALLYYLILFGSSKFNLLRIFGVEAMIDSETADGEKPLGSGRRDKVYYMVPSELGYFRRILFTAMGAQDTLISDLRSGIRRLWKSISKGVMRKPDAEDRAAMAMQTDSSNSERFYPKV